MSIGPLFKLHGGVSIGLRGLGFRGLGFSLGFRVLGSICPKICPIPKHHHEPANLLPTAVQKLGTGMLRNRTDVAGATIVPN